MTVSFILSFLQMNICQRYPNQSSQKMLFQARYPRLEQWDGDSSLLPKKWELIDWALQMPAHRQYHYPSALRYHCNNQIRYLHPDIFSPIEDSEFDARHLFRYLELRLSTFFPRSQHDRFVQKTVEPEVIRFFRNEWINERLNHGRKFYLLE